MALTVMLALSACTDAVSGSPPGTAEAQPRPVIEQVAENVGAKTIRLGSSLYAVRIAREFSSLRISNEEWEDDVVARYRNENTLLDFDIYQFSKEGYPDTLEEFVREEAEEYGATEVVTGESVNGIAVGHYRSVNDYGGAFRDGFTYALENGDEYIELDFWFIGYHAESEALEIVDSLTIIESDPLPFGAYQILIPKDFTLASGEDANPTVYASGSESLRLYVSRFPAGGMSLSDFARSQAVAKGGTDIETEAKINGVPVAFYRSIDALDGAFHSMLTAVLDDGGGFTALSFRLDGITAEAETTAILDTLSKQPQFERRK
ncbi:MAG: hypothetical protein IJT31_09985 [Oscillibacter sp.]|nr:hypothetical protein [Oscillibacter sp.]